MAVKMRLMRMGKTKSPYYRVVVMDGRAPRDGRYIDLIGRYDPRQEPSVIDIDGQKAIDWLRKGAQPTEAVAKLLDRSGVSTEFKVRSGRIHTVGGPAASEAPEASEVDASEEAEVSQEAEVSEEEASEPEESADVESEEAPEADETAEAGSEEE